MKIFSTWPGQLEAGPTSMLSGASRHSTCISTTSSLDMHSLCCFTLIPPIEELEDGLGTGLWPEGREGQGGEGDEGGPGPP